MNLVDVNKRESAREIECVCVRESEREGEPEVGSYSNRNEYQSGSLVRGPIL